MMDRRHGHRSSLHFTMRADELFDGTKPAASKFAGYRVSLCNIRIHHANQPHRLTLLGKLLINAGMIASKCTHTDHRDVYEVDGGQFYFPAGEIEGHVDLITNGDEAERTEGAPSFRVLCGGRGFPSI